MHGKQRWVFDLGQPSGGVGGGTKAAAALWLKWACNWRLKRHSGVAKGWWLQRAWQVLGDSQLQQRSNLQEMLLSV
jgi:hypothetical protein